MKYEKLISRLIALIMAFTLAFAGVGCLVTGYGLNVDMTTVTWNILIAALIAVIAANSGKGNLILGVLIALLLNHLWYRQDLESSVEGLLYWISQRTDIAYGWGVLYWSEVPPVDASLETVLSVATIPVIWAVAWTVLRRRSAILAVPVSILMPAACFMITNSVPETWCLFLLCAGLLLLVLTQTVRRRSARDGNRMVALMLIPALLCTSILFWAVPMDSYSTQFETPKWMQNLLGSFGGPGIGNAEPGTAVDLSTLGPKLETDEEVMRVTSTQKGLIYLRGQAYDVYDSLIWSISNVDTTKDNYWPTVNMKPAGRVRITTNVPRRLQYIPYYVRNGIDGLVEGRLEGEATTQYSFPVVIRDGGKNLNVTVVRDELVLQCLQLPAATSAEAKEIVKGLGIFPAYSDGVKAQAIKAYVSNLAEYNTQTGTMPRGEKDFALWFMTKAESGYCVHFATAATVLLRAAGVPARYVTGYMVEVNEKNTPVQQRHAHAWVEYLDSERGWTVLDPTPVDDILGDNTEPTAPTETVPTEPSEITEPSGSTTPTLPSEATEPTDPTGSQGTNPTGVTEPGESTAPQETQPSEQQTAIALDWSWLWNILQYVVLGLSVIGVVAGQYFLRIGLRNRRRRKKAPNQRALDEWREVIWLSRLLRQPIPEELEELAEKARFSQHILTQTEARMFRRQIDSLGTVLRSRNWLCRWVLKLVFAIA